MRIRPLFKSPQIISIILISLAFLVLYRNVFLKHYIAFPANFLAAFYSPWATQKFEGYPNGVPHKPIGGNDQVRMFYPYRTFSNESLKRGELPLWNPYNFSGSPILANFQSATFYPPNLLYLILPQADAWTILTLIQPILALIFMYIYLQNRIQNKSAALMGAFSFGLSGAIVTWSQENAVVGHALLWFPLLLFATDKVLESKEKKYLLLLTFAIFSCMLAGHHQFSFQVLVSVGAYTIYRLIQNKETTKSKLLKITICYAIALFFALIQLIPTFQAFALTPRSSTSSESVVNEYLVTPTHFIFAVLPDLFGNPGSYNYIGKGFYQERVFYAGVIPFIFALLALKNFKKKSDIKFFSLLAVVTYALSIDWFVSRLFFKLPLINTFTPSRLLTITSPAVSILAAFGFDAWTKQQLQRRTAYKLIGAIFIATLFVLGILFICAKIHTPTTQTITNYLVRPKFDYQMEFFQIGLRNSFLPLLMLIALAATMILKKPHRYAVIFVLCITALGQFYYYNKYLVLSDRKFLYPNHFIFEDMQQNQNQTERFLSFGSPILGNVALDKHLFSPDGLDPIFPARYGQLLFAAKNDGKFTTNIPRIEANLSEYSENGNIRNNFYRLRLISLLGVTRVYNYENSYLGNKKFEEIFPVGQFTPLWKNNGWQAYRNEYALPRAFLATEYKVEKDPQKIFDIIFDPEINLKRTIVLEEQPANFKSKKTDWQGSAEITEYAPQTVQIKTTAPEPALLFLSDNNYPGWRVFVDGKQQKIYQADYTFRAVVVPAGDHIVTFKFMLF